MSTNARDLSYIGLNIKQIRKEKGLSQRGLAKLCGYLPTTMGRFENGAAVLKVTQLFHIAAVLEVSVEYIITSPLAITETPVIPEGIGKKVRATREARKLTRRELAGYTGVPEHHITLIENDIFNKHSWIRLKKLSEFLSIQIN